MNYNEVQKSLATAKAELRSLLIQKNGDCVTFNAELEAKIRRLFIDIEELTDIKNQLVAQIEKSNKETSI